MAAVKDALDPSWINAPGGVGPSYDAEELRRLQGYQLAGGATAGSSRTGVLNPRDLALSLSGSNVLVGAGGAVIGTAKGAYVCGVATTTTIGALLAADVTNPRRDRVVLRILDPDNGGPAGRKAQLEIIDGTPNASAATGGGYPAAPAGPFIDLGYVDVPKSGAGSPSLTINSQITAAAGAAVPVRDAADMGTLPKYDGAHALRLDLNAAIFTCIGGTWLPVNERLAPLASPVAGWSASGEIVTTRQGDRLRVDYNIELKRTGASMPIPVNAALTGIGPVFPPAVRGSGQSIWQTSVVSGSGVNMDIHTHVSTGSGVVSYRSRSAFTLNALANIYIIGFYTINI